MYTKGQVLDHPTTAAQVVCTY